MLSVKRWRRMHDLGMDLLQVEESDAQIRLGLDSLLQLVPADVAADVAMDAAGRPRITEVPDLLLPVVGADVEVVFQDNPALVHLSRHGTLPASRVEDLCAPERWASNPMRRLLLEPNRVPHALLVAHRTPGGGMQGWGLNRSRPFADDELELVAAFEGFLSRAARDRDQTTLVIDLDRAVTAGAGLVLSRGDEVTYLNEEAATLLERHQVPVATVTRIGRTALSPTSPTGALPTRSGALRLRWRPALAGSSAVVLDEPAGDADGRPKITARQHAILCHLSQSLTAAAIGRKLGIQERTVHKHLEHLYRALAVRDRLGAVLRGRELGLLPVVGGCGRLDGSAPL